MSPLDPRNLLARRAFLKRGGMGLGAAMLGDLLHGRESAGLAPHFEVMDERDAQAAMTEALLSMHRAGADIMITYWAREFARQVGG